MPYSRFPASAAGRRAIARYSRSAASPAADRPVVGPDRYARAAVGRFFDRVGPLDPRDPNFDQKADRAFAQEVSRYCMDAKVDYARGKDAMHDAVAAANTDFPSDSEVLRESGADLASYASALGLDYASALEDLREFLDLYEADSVDKSIREAVRRGVRLPELGEQIKVR